MLNVAPLRHHWISRHLFNNEFALRHFDKKYLETAYVKPEKYGSSIAAAYAHASFQSLDSETDHQRDWRLA